MRVSLSLITVLSLILVSTGGATESETTRYVAGDGRTVIWCSSEPHPLDEEPECVGAEANNAVNAWNGDEREAFGIGGFYKHYDTDDLGKVVSIVPQDDLYGSSVYLILQGPASASTGQRDAFEGCGPQAVMVPYDPVGSILGIIPAVGITDDLDVCGGTTGTV